MALLQSEVVPKNSGAAFEMTRGQRLRIAGKSIVDFVAFNLHDLNERFDQARTKTNQVKIFISTGEVDINPKKPEEIPDHGCWENLSEAVKPWNISPDDVPSPFNIFQCMRIDPETGMMYDTMIRPKDEAHVDFRAEMDCLVAVSACPESGRGQAIRVEIFDD